MIGEKIKNPKKSSSKVKRVGGLLDYLRAPSRTRSQEKCLHYAGQGLLTGSPAAHRLEMIALATEAARSVDPINHYVLSWRQGEQPSAEQVDEAATIVLQHMGLDEHQAVWALHGDTDNYHVHLVVNRVHPLTERPVKVEWDIERLHEAMALIEHKQGWRPEQRARYVVDDQGKLQRQQHEPRQQPDRRQRAMERQTGTQSAQRQAMEVAGPIIGAAQSWEQVHRELAAQGMRYERTGSGAVVWVGDTAVKASKVARQAGFGKLQQRLGAYEPAPEGLQVASRQPQRTRPDHPRWADYTEAREAACAARRSAQQRLGAIIERQRAQLQQRQRQRREQLLGGDWKGRGELLNAMRKVLGDEQRAERKALQQRHAEARAVVRSHHPPYPSFRTWLTDSGRLADAAQTRLAEVAVAPVPTQRQGHGIEALHARFAADWQRERGPAELALGRAAQAHARHVARVQRTSSRRWAAARLMMRGRVSGAIWAKETKRAVRRDWERLHEQRGRQVREMLRAHPTLDFTAWLQQQAKQGDRDALVALRNRRRGGRPGNAVAGTGRFSEQALKVGADAVEVTAQGAVVYEVGQVRLLDEGDRLRVSGDSADGCQRLLEVARQRFGRRLGVAGDDAFVGRLVQAAAASGLDIEFADTALEQRRRALLANATSQRPPRGGSTEEGYEGHSGRARGADGQLAGAGQGAAGQFPGAGPRPHQSNPAWVAADPTAKPRARVRTMPELAVARVQQLPRVLLPRDARRDVEQRRPAADRGLRRSLERVNDSTRSRGRSR